MGYVGRRSHFVKFVFFVPSSDGSVQSAIDFAGFSREYITFNFKGEGHAQLLFQEDVSITNEKAFTVSINHY